MANQQTPKKGGQVKDYLAIGITIVSIVGVVALSITVMMVAEAGDKSTAANMVLAATFPLLGSWVGTILAYYFSRDNFEAATRNVRAMTQPAAVRSALRDLPVKENMIPKNKIFSAKFPAENIMLVDILYDLSRAKYHRLPVFKEDDSPAYLIHRKLMDRYLALKSIKEETPAIKKLNLQDLLGELGKDDPDYQELNEILENSFATVGINASLADAKAAMEALPECQDVFVTEKGTPDSKVLGWITNAIITENAKA